MEHCSGGNLAEAIQNQKQKPFPESQIHKILYSILLAVQCIHEMNMLHRDVKAENIFLTAKVNSPACIVKLGDFGTAKEFKDEAVSTLSTKIGTLHLWPPEIVSGKSKFDAKCEIYSLGVLAYHIAALRLPFDGMTLQDVRKKILQGSPEKLPLELSSDLHSLIKNMLAKDPSNRWSLMQIFEDPWIKRMASINRDVKIAQSEQVISDLKRDMAVISDQSRQLTVDFQQYQDEMQVSLLQIKDTIESLRHELTSTIVNFSSQASHQPKTPKGKDSGSSSLPAWIMLSSEEKGQQTEAKLLASLPLRKIYSTKSARLDKLRADVFDSLTRALEAKSGYVLIGGEVGVGKAVLVAEALRSNVSKLVVQYKVDKVIWFPATEFENHQGTIEPLSFIIKLSTQLEVKDRIALQEKLRQCGSSLLLVMVEVSSISKTIEILQELQFFGPSLLIGRERISAIVPSPPSTPSTPITPSLASPVTELSTHPVFNIEPYLRSEIANFLLFGYPWKSKRRPDIHGLEKLADLCCGLPLAADCVIMHLATFEESSLQDAVNSLIVGKHLAISQLSDGRKTVSEHLVEAFKADAEVLGNFAAFLLVDAESTLTDDELKILWNVPSIKEVAKKCELLHQRGLIRRKNGSYFIHGLLYQAAYANQSAIDKWFAKLFEEMSTLPKEPYEWLRSGENALHALIRSENRSLIESLVNCCDTKTRPLSTAKFAKLCLQQDGEKKQTPLHFLYVKRALNFHWACQILIRLISRLPDEVQQVENAFGETIYAYFVRPHGCRVYLSISAAEDKFVLRAAAELEGFDFAIHDKSVKLTCSDIVTAIRLNKQDEIKTWLDIHGPNSSLSRRGSTIAHYAAAFGNIELLRHLLVDLKVPPIIRNNDEATPLHYAAYTGKLKALKLLLEQPGCDPNVTNNTGNTPLHATALLGADNEMIKALIKAGGKFNKNKFGQTPVHSLALGGSETMALLFLTLDDADFTGKSNLGNNPVHLAARSGRVLVLRWLLDKGGVDVNAKNNEGNTPLHYAAFENCTETTAHLVAHSQIDLNAKNSLGDTPLHVAAVGGSYDSMKLLLQCQAVDVNARNYDEDTPLHLVGMAFHEETRKHFLCEPYQPKNWDHIEWHVQTTKLLLSDRRVDVSARNKLGKLPLDVRLGDIKIKPMSVCSTVAHIVTFGRTGAGKSWCGNRLLKSGQSRFTEDDGDESSTKCVTARVAFNEDVMSDVPGYFDSAGRDQEQQANFVDFLKNKTIRAILFLYTDRVDSFMKAAIKAFRESGLQNNIIFVKNKVLMPPPAEVEILDGCPKVSIMVNQSNFDVLKRYLEVMTPVVATNLLIPVSLFGTPLEIVREEIVEEFVEDREISVIVKVSKQEHVPVQKVIKPGPIKGWLGDVTGLDGKAVITEYEKRTNYHDEIVKKPHKIFNRCKYTYAMRFDNVADIYKKEVIEVVTKEVQ